MNSIPSVVDQSYLPRGTQRQRSSDKAIAEQIRYNLSQFPTEMTDVDLQPNATTSTTTPDTGMRNLKASPLRPPNSEENALQSPNLAEDHRALDNLLRNTGRLQSFTTETDLRSLEARSLWSSIPPHRPPPPISTWLPHISRSRPLSTILPLSTDPPPSTSPSSSTSSSPSGGSRTTRTKIIAGVVTPASVIIILGLIVFYMLRRKHRNRASRSASLQPFLDFPARRSNSTAKGLITGRTGSSFTRRNQADIEQCADPSSDIEPAEGNLSNSVDEGQRLKKFLIRLQALIGRFGRKVRQIDVLAQSGQPSADNGLVLEERRHTTDLIIPCGSNHETARSLSVGLTSPPPPPYCSLHN